MPDRLICLSLVIALFAACGDAEDDFAAPTCAPGEVAIEGTIDGGQESARLSSPTGYAFINALGDELGSLTVTFGDDMLFLEWPDLVANGDSVEARGAVAVSSLSYGNCEDDGFPGTLQMNNEGGGGAFRLTALRPGGDCGQPEVSGELTGCFESSNQ